MLGPHGNPPSPTAPSPGQPTPGVVKQDKSSGGSVDTTKTRSDAQRVRLSSGERLIGAAKGKRTNTVALCQKPAPQFHAASNPQVDDCRVENNLLEAVITLNGVPLPVASCTDGVQNGDETAVDAGGSCAAAAPTGSTCSDGLQNGDEMGIDYGGSCSRTVPVPGGYPGDDTDAGPGGLDGGDCRNGVVDFEGLVDNAPLPDDYGSPYIKFSLVETGTFVPYPNGHRPVAEVPPPLSRCGPPPVRRRRGFA